MSKSFYSKEEYCVSDLLLLIKEEVEESLHLDYKSARSISKADDKKRELAKDVSSFANSDGGIIIYGMEEENHKPKEISYIDGTIFTKEWFENVIDDNIQQKIDGLKIFPVRIENDLSKSVYIIKIPQSTNVPHMSPDKKYYRRYNFKAVPMEEYEIRLLYKRTSVSEIDFNSVWSSWIKNETETITKQIICWYDVFIHVINISDVIEKNCKIEATLLNAKNLDIKYGLYPDSNLKQRLSKEKSIIITGFNESPIFPNEEHVIMKFQLQIPKKSLEEFRTKALLDLVLYDSSTTKSCQYNLDELFSITDSDQLA